MVPGGGGGGGGGGSICLLDLGLGDGLGDGIGDYKLEVDGVYRDLMTRQVGEDARMSLCHKNVELINSKNE